MVKHNKADVEADRRKKLHIQLVQAKSDVAKLRRERAARSKDFDERLKAIRAERDAFRREARETKRALAQAEKRNKTRTKDPNRLKRPPSAYICFMKHMRPKYVEANPNLKVPDVGRMAGADWKKMSDEEKQPFKDMSDAAKAEYEKKKAAPSE